MPAELQLTPVGLPHVAVLAALHRAAFPGGWGVDTLAAGLANPAVGGILATAAGTPVGFVLWQASAEEAEILTLAVVPTARRQGVAGRLLATAQATLSAVGVGRLLLEVAADNRPARGLYAQGGFTEIGRRRGYYRRKGGAVDALVLETRLG